MSKILIGVVATKDQRPCLDESIEALKKQSMKSDVLFVTDNDAYSALIKSKGFDAVLFKDLGNGECQLFTYEGVAKPEIIEVGAAGLGCSLIKRKVLEQVELTGDMQFYVEARAKGFTASANTMVKCMRRPYPITDPRSQAFDWSKRVESNTIVLDENSGNN